MRSKSAAARPAVFLRQRLLEIGRVARQESHEGRLDAQPGFGVGRGDEDEAVDHQRRGATGAAGLAEDPLVKLGGGGQLVGAADRAEKRRVPLPRPPVAASGP